MNSIFYKSVQTYYPELQEILLANPGMIIAIPQDCSMRAVMVSKSLIRAHVLRPLDDTAPPTVSSDNPNITTEWYITLCGKSVQLRSIHDPITGNLTRHFCVGVKRKRTSIMASTSSTTTTTSTPTTAPPHLGTSFNEARTVEIVDDEMCYGVTTASFTAYILERPLMGRGDIPRLKDGTTPLYDSDRPASQWTQVFLDIAQKDSVTSNVYQRCLRLATKIPQVFANVCDAADVCDAAEDLHEASEGLAKSLSQSKVFIHAAHVPRLFSSITEALESIVCSASYPDTFGIYCDRTAKAERILMTELFQQRERGWRPKELQGDLSTIQLPKSIAHLYHLNDARSPLAKLQCIHNVIQSIMEDVNHHSLTTSSTTTVIAADELLPLLITTICEAALPCLLANTLYMREVSSQNLRDTKLGYGLAMFEAAVSFIGRKVWSTITEELGDRDFGVAGVVGVVGTTVEEGTNNNSSTGSGSSSETTNTKSNEVEDHRHRKTSLDATPEEMAQQKFGDGLISQAELDTILQSSAVFRKLVAAADVVNDGGAVETNQEETKATEEVASQLLVDIEVDETIDPLAGIETRGRALTIT